MSLIVSRRCRVSFAKSPKHKFFTRTPNGIDRWSCGCRRRGWFRSTAAYHSSSLAGRQPRHSQVAHQFVTLLFFCVVTMSPARWSESRYLISGLAVFIVSKSLLSKALGRTLAFSRCRLIWSSTKPRKVRHTSGAKLSLLWAVRFPWVNTRLAIRVMKASSGCSYNSSR